MKWFKHETDAHKNLKHQAVIEKFGLEAYGYYWACDELVGDQGVNYRIKSEKDWKIFFKKFLNIEIEKQNSFLKFFAEKGLIDKKAFNKGDLYIPKLAERADEYTKRVRRVSEQDTDNVPLEEKRRDKKRIEEIREELGNGIDQDNFYKALEILSLREITNNQLETIKALIKKHPSQNYPIEARKMLTWWEEHKKKMIRPISAFSNWLEKSNPDPEIQQQKKNLELEKKQKERAETTEVDEEGLKQLRELKNKFKIGR